MDPITIAILGSLAGSAVSGLGSILGGNAQADGAMYAGQAARDGAYFRAAALEQGGLFAEQEAEFQALQLDQAAMESRGAAQRQAQEKRWAAKLALSSLVARAASQGGGAADTTVVNLAGDIAERGEFLALSEMYTGENRARGLEDQAMGVRITGAAKKWGASVEAKAARYEGDTRLTAARLGGDAARTAGYMNAGGTILSGIGRAFSMKAPPSTHYDGAFMPRADYG